MMQDIDDILKNTKIKKCKITTNKITKKKMRIYRLITDEKESELEINLYGVYFQASNDGTDFIIANKEDIKKINKIYEWIDKNHDCWGIVAPLKVVDHGLLISCHFTSKEILEEGTRYDIAIKFLPTARISTPPEKKEKHGVRIYHDQNNLRQSVLDLESERTIVTSLEI